MPAATLERAGVGVVAGAAFGGGLRTVEVLWSGDVSEGASTDLGVLVESVRMELVVKIDGEQ